jgi:hypothetical protein
MGLKVNFQIEERKKKAHRSEKINKTNEVRILENGRVNVR